MKKTVPQKLDKVIQIDEAQIQQHLGELVRGTVEDTLNKLLDAEVTCPHERRRTSFLAPMT